MAKQEIKLSAWRQKRAESARKFIEALMAMPEPTQEQKERSKKLSAQILSKKSFHMDKILNGF